MIVLGVNAPPRGWHDTAACLVAGGEVLALGEEERFSRRKHAPHEPPREAIAFCLRHAGLSIADVDVVAVGWDVPKLVPGLDARDYLAYVLGGSPPAGRPELAFIPHHLAHAACALFASPFRDAAVLVVDGLGEAESVSIYAASAGRLTLLRRWPIAASLGLLYDAACKSVGLSSLEAGKLMGLAAYGRARGVPPWPLASLAEDGYALALACDPGAGHEEVIARWQRLLRERRGGAEVRAGRAGLDEDEAAVATAWSVQACVEAVVPHLAALARRAAGREELCLAGGVALNCAANGLVPEPLYVPPVPHDAGVALGAAWALSPPAGPPRALDPYLGAAPEGGVGAAACAWEPFDAERIAERLAAGRIGAVVEGRAEVGPRALGHRSILALPRPASRRDEVNRVKSREPWRPFAPVALAECDGALWDGRRPFFRYMVGATPVAEAGKAVIPAAMHVDGTARPQVVEDGAGAVASILAALRRGGLPPVLLNTSFNGPGEPIVNSAADAIAAFERLGLDFLVLGDGMALRGAAVAIDSRP